MLLKPGSAQASWATRPICRLDIYLIITILHSTVMVSIWEGNQCKKAQLTLTEISATIANKVVSQSNHTCSWEMWQCSLFLILFAILGDIPAQNLAKYKRCIDSCIVYKHKTKKCAGSRTYCTYINLNLFICLELWCLPGHFALLVMIKQYFLLPTISLVLCFLFRKQFFFLQIRSFDSI